MSEPNLVPAVKRPGSPRGRDRTGTKFGSLTAVCDTGRRVPKSTAAIWLWACDCGGWREANASELSRVVHPRCGPACALRPPPKARYVPTGRPRGRPRHCPPK